MAIGASIRCDRCSRRSLQTFQLQFCCLRCIARLPNALLGGSQRRLQTVDGQRSQRHCVPVRDLQRAPVHMLARAPCTHATPGAEKPCSDTYDDDYMYMAQAQRVVYLWHLDARSDGFLILNYPLGLHDRFLICDHGSSTRCALFGVGTTTFIGGAFCSSRRDHLATRSRKFQSPQGERLISG